MQLWVPSARPEDNFIGKTLFSQILFCLWKILEKVNWKRKDADLIDFLNFYFYFFGGQECAGHSFAYVAHL
jgi:hypothetical protein